MQPNLEILLRHSYLSRKQVRELQADLPGSLPQLRAALLQRGWMDPPDWKEAQALLLAPVESKDEDQAPDSANAAMQRV